MECKWPNQNFPYPVCKGKKGEFHKIDLAAKKIMQNIAK
jgi:hypothetical protein